MESSNFLSCSFGESLKRFIKWFFRRVFQVQVFLMRARITAQSNEIEMTLYAQIGMDMILCFVKRENSVREDCCQHVNIRTSGDEKVHKVSEG